MAASMNAHLCLPCPKTAGGSRTAPAAHSLTRVLGDGPVRRKNGRVGRVAVRAVLTPSGYSPDSQNAGFDEIPTPSIPSLGESLNLFCSLQGRCGGLWITLPRTRRGVRSMMHFSVQSMQVAYCPNNTCLDSIFCKAAGGD